MPVTLTINQRQGGKSRGNRGLGFDKEIESIASTILEAQRDGYIAPHEIAALLNDLPTAEMTRVRYSSSAVRRMLRRGVRLGIRFHLQTAAEAGARPRRLRRSRNQIALDMRQRALAAAKRREGDILSAMALTSASGD